MISHQIKLINKIIEIIEKHQVEIVELKITITNEKLPRGSDLSWQKKETTELEIGIKIIQSEKQKEQ